MFRTLAITSLGSLVTLAGATLPAQEATYVRPDGNGYFYHQGASPFRPGSPYRPIDEAILHDDLDRRDYQRSRILETGLRYGNLTPAQRRALVNELQHSRARDDAYHSGYHRGQSTYPTLPYRSGYRGSLGYGPTYQPGPIVPYRSYVPNPWVR